MRAALTCLAPLSMIAAHIAAYQAAAPGHHAHEELFAATGHGSGWWIAALLVTIVTGAVLQSADKRGPYVARRRDLLLRTAVTLGLVQTIAFIALEVFERAAAGAASLGILQEPVMVLGIALQIVVAVLTALVVVFLVEVVTRLWGRTTSLRRDGAPLISPSSADILKLAAACAPAAPRGPPLHL